MLLPLAIVALLQGRVAIAQFMQQSSVGLDWLGELALHRELRGYSIVWAQNQRWLRAYGLTGHPNVLAATMLAGFWFSLRGPPLAFAGWLIPTPIAVFDATLWITTSVRGAVLMGTLAAAVSLAAVSEDVMT